MKALLFCIALVIAHTAALAAEPSPRSLERLLEVTQAQKMTDAVRQQVDTAMRPILDQALGSRNLSAEQRAEAERLTASFVQKMNGIMAEELSWSRMKEFTMQIYRESFTQEEVDGLIAFYESPAGKAYIEKMPVVMQKSMALMQQRMGPMMQRMQAAAREAAMEFRNGQVPRN